MTVCNRVSCPGAAMKRSVGIGALLAFAFPLALVAQGIPAAPAAVTPDSLARAANAAAAANTVAINFVWTLVAGFLVMFMQAGVAMVETGLCRAKNANHTMMMNFMVYGFGLFAYWVCGFALQMGGAGAIWDLGGTAPLSNEYTINVFGKPYGLFGTHGFFLTQGGTYDVAVMVFFLF